MFLLLYIFRESSKIMFIQSKHFLLSRLTTFFHGSVEISEVNDNSLSVSLSVSPSLLFNVFFLTFWIDKFKYPLQSRCSHTGYLHFLFLHEISVPSSCFLTNSRIENFNSVIRTGTIDFMMNSEYRVHYVPSSRQEEANIN